MPNLSNERRQAIETSNRICIAPHVENSRIATHRRNVLARALTATAREPLIVLDCGLRIVAASQSYRAMFPASCTVDGGLFPRANVLSWNKDALQILQGVFSDNHVIENREIELDLPAIGKRTMLLNARRFGDRANEGLAMVVGLEDLSEKREVDANKIALLEHTEMLLAEVQHRIANSLQIVASVLLLRARAATSEEARLHLKDAHRRMLAVATVQRQLSLSRSGNDVELGPYLTALCDNLASSMTGDDDTVTIAASIADGSVESEDAVRIGLIVTELVINSLKHGFPNGRKGHIDVRYAGGRGSWHLTVSDDGIGWPLDAPLPSARIGLGARIVEALAKSLKAQVVVEKSPPGAATTIIHSA